MKFHVRIKCFFGFHWWLQHGNFDKTGFICGWCKKERLF